MEARPEAVLGLERTWRFEAAGDGRADRGREAGAIDAKLKEVSIGLKQQESIESGPARAQPW